MDHDAAHKYIYSLPEVTADLLRLIIPGWVEELDLATLEDRSSEHLDAAHRKRLGDMAWRVGFRGGRRRLDFWGAAGGGLALGEPGVGDRAAAGGRDAAGVAAAAAAGGGPLPWAGEQAVSAGTAFLGAGAVGAKDWRRGLPGL